MRNTVMKICLLALFPALCLAQICPEKNLQYWQAFPPGGESDLSARHQQGVLKKKCGAIDTVVQYKAGAGGALMWSQINGLPADGNNIVGINLPHIVFPRVRHQMTQVVDSYRASLKLATTKGSTGRLGSVF